MPPRSRPGGLNLALVAALALADACPDAGGALVEIEKRIPVAGGLGGGSADAAATLLALNELWGCDVDAATLEEIGERIGSDVPAMLSGESVLMAGRGERLAPAEVPPLHWVLVRFGFGVRSPDAYRWWDEDGAATGPDPDDLLAAATAGDAEALGPLLFNDLETPVATRHPEIGEAKRRLLEAGALGAVMSGSGSSVIGLARDRGARPNSWRPGSRARSPSWARRRTRHNREPVRGRLTARRGPLEPSMEVRLLPPERADEPPHVAEARRRGRREARRRGQSQRPVRRGRSRVPEVACPSCGTLNPEGFRFCGSCGSAMERTCPSCGSTNPATNAFCGSCGTGLDAPPAAPALEERKVVSMLFADLTASTEMASRLDPEDLRAVLRPFFDTMVEEIDRYGGTVEKYIGDAIVAAFGAPVAHEDDPERAIRCALAMQRRVPELNDALAERAGGDLSLRIGINTGEVVAHSIEEGIVTGEAVNIAARFQSLAEPGHVVVGERTYRDAREAFTFSDLGEVSVKGVDRPLRVFAVDGESSPRDSFAGHETPFVGRGAEMELLRLLFSRTVDAARPNLVTIVGPPGIGKSRLSREVARTLEREGARVVRGRCLPYGDGLTYWPLAEILKTDAGILDSDAAATALAKARERLDPRFPGDEGIGVTSILLSSIGVEWTRTPSPEPNRLRRTG